MKEFCRTSRADRKSGVGAVRRIGQLGVADHVREARSDVVVCHGDGFVIALQRPRHLELVPALVELRRLEADGEGPQASGRTSWISAAMAEE